MADRVVNTTDTLNYFRHEFNGTAADVGDIQAVLDASSYIASSTDVIEAIVAINAEIPEITTDAFVFPASTMVWEGATDDDYEMTLSFTDPTADRTWTFPDGGGGVMLTDTVDTSTAKTFTTPTITSPVLNTAVSGSAVLDEDDMSSDSATKVATQQSIKAYVDNQIDSDMDLVFAGDSGGNLQITMDSETMTFAGGTGIDSAGSGNTMTFNIDSTVTTLTGSQTLTNKTLTSPTFNTSTLNTQVSGSAILDEDNMSSNSATQLATQQSIKAYVDAQVTAEDLDATTDSGNVTVDLDSQTMSFVGGTGISVSASSQTVTPVVTSAVGITTASQTFTNKTFTEPVLNTYTYASGQALSSLYIGPGTSSQGIIFEGATADAYETTLTAANPTQDNVITIPDASMTCVTTATHASKFVHIVRCIALG